MRTHVIWKPWLLKVKVAKYKEANLDKAAIFLRNCMVKTFQPRRTPPSLPGEPPATPTGTLRRSIMWETPRRGVRRVGSTLRGSPASYALYLELGTRKMQPRPWLMPSLNNNRRSIKKILTKGKI